MKTWGIYVNDYNEAVDTVEAESEYKALQEFARKNNIPDHKIDNYWAEELDA